MIAPHLFNHFKHNDNYKAEGCLPWIKFLDRFDTESSKKRQKKILVYLPTPGTDESFGVQPCTSRSSRIKGPGLSYQTLYRIYSAEDSNPLCRSSLPLNHLWCGRERPVCTAYTRSQAQDSILGQGNTN